MSIQRSVIELQRINARLKVLNKERTQLMKQKKVHEEFVQSYLEETGQPGVKYQGIAVVAKPKEGRIRKKASEKHQDMRNVLEDYGVRDIDRALRELENARLGEMEMRSKIELTDVGNI